MAIIRMRGNVGMNIGGDFIRVEGDTSNLQMDLEDNMAFNVGGHMVNIVRYNEIRQNFPQLALLSDEELARASSSIAGKSFDAAKTALHNVAAFATIATADWPELLHLLGWAA